MQVAKKERRGMKDEIERESVRECVCVWGGVGHDSERDWKTGGGTG